MSVPNDISSFVNIICDFTNDICLSFPELETNLHEDLVASRKREVNDAELEKRLLEHCKTVYAPHFFDILYEHDNIFENDIFFLPNINFKYVWCNEITENTKATIWKYLQLVMLMTMQNFDSCDTFGEAQKLFEAISEDELKSKLESTVKEMQGLFGDNTFDVSHADIDPEKIHEHMSQMLDGKIGKLAKEIAEETAGSLELDPDKIGSVDDAFKQMFKDPGKLMRIVKDVGSKLDAKIKSGEIKESELMEEASELMKRMKDMPGMANFEEMIGKMQGKEGKMNKNMFEAKLNDNIRQAKMRERMLKKLEENRKKKQEGQGVEANATEDANQVKSSTKRNKKKRRNNKKV